MKNALLFLPVLVSGVATANEHIASQTNTFSSIGAGSFVSSGNNALVLGGRLGNEYHALELSATKYDDFTIPRIGYKFGGENVFASAGYYLNGERNYTFGSSTTDYVTYDLSAGYQFSDVFYLKYEFIYDKTTKNVPNFSYQEVTYKDTYLSGGGFLGYTDGLYFRYKGGIVLSSLNHNSAASGKNDTTKYSSLFAQFGGGVMFAAGPYLDLGVMMLDSEYGDNTVFNFELGYQF